MNVPPLHNSPLRTLPRTLAFLLAWWAPLRAAEPPASANPIETSLTETAATPALRLTRTPAERAELLRTRPWIETIEREITPLRHRIGGRLPMIMWHGVGFQPLSTAEIDMLRARGLCQHLQLDDSMIPAARALADAGAPIILMEGRTDSWPYSLTDLHGGKPGDWAHQFDLTFVPSWIGKDDTSQWHGACPQRTAGWLVLEQQTRQTMQKFKDAGIQVDAVLVDYEGDPYPWSHLFEQLRHCRRCRQELPAEVVGDKGAWRDYAWQQYVNLYDRHFAKPIRDVFPNALVTNWHVVFSSREIPVRYFVQDVSLPELRPRYFSATNPIAYGSDGVWRERWNPLSEPTQPAVDEFYALELLHMVASDRRNRELAGADSVRSIPWVARVCLIESDPVRELPIMSRERYRDSLGELWELGVHGMQVFNPLHNGYEELALTELQDAVAAYDRMLATP